MNDSPFTKPLAQTKSTRENLTIRMDPKLKKTLKHRAVEEDRDLSDLLEDAAHLYLSRQAS
ncbi:MAG: ribbon-helix-helix protein, CopG family [Leptolyngbyaceae cyanobacterium]